MSKRTKGALWLTASVVWLVIEVGLVMVAPPWFFIFLILPTYAAVLWGIEGWKEVTGRGY